MNSGGYWVSKTLVVICCGDDEHVFNRNPSPDSYDAYWEGENEGNKRSKDKPPPGHLNLIV
ncbi:hypothetical protein Hdeb2414_s0001g00042531 [Helianthus debilis subsp. tardiflorus]